MTVIEGKTDPVVAWCAWEDVRKDDTWLVSFVDLLIILLATLVVLIGQMTDQPTPPRTPYVPPTATSTAIPFATTVSDDRQEHQRSGRLAADSQTRGIRLAKLVQERFQGEIRAVRSEQGVILEISDAVLFDSARATLRQSASSMLIRLAATLQESGDALVAVEGHTDDRPVQSGEFSSNWELAAARAYAVTHFLIGQGLEAGRLRAVSYADTRPTADNETPEGRAANRRVELRVEFSQN
ncbi:MAG: OmpA/MotB family protein [Woeseiaceae bacterium]